MAIAQRGTATTGTQPNSTSVSAAKPTGVKNGDVLIAVLVSNDQSATAPSGWVKFEEDTSDFFRSQLFYKVAGGFEPSSYTFSVGSAAPLVLTITAWAGVDRDVPLGGATQLASAGNASEPVSTPTLANAACTDGRVLYVRASRKADSAPGSPLTFESSKGEVVQAGVYSGGSVSYSVGVFADSTDFSAAGTKAGAAITASGAETHNVVATVILNRGPHLPQSPVQGAGEGGAPAVQPTGVFVATYEFDLEEDDYLIPQENHGSNVRMYYKVIPLPSGKAISRTWRPAPEVPDVTPDRNEYPATVTTVAEAVAYDEANAPQQTYVFNSEGYAVAITARGFAQYNAESSNPEWKFQTGELGQFYARSFVIGDIPS